MAREPTLRADGWHRHPDAGDGPLIDPGTGVAVAAHDPACAYRVLVEELLDEIVGVVAAPSCPVTPVR